MKLSTFLMYPGQAEAAMNFYVETFPGGQVVSVERYRPGEPGPVGSIRRATFELNGRRFHCTDSPAPTSFTFTPAMSLCIECDTLAEFEHLYERLKSGGQVFMPPDSYGFSQRFTWLQDTYGVSWQLNVA